MSKEIRKWVKSLLPASKKILLQTGATSGPASIQALETALTPLTKYDNRYGVYRELLRMDPEANNAINRLALLVQWAYQGLHVHAERELDNEEKLFQQRANEEAEKLNFRARFFSHGKHLLRDGDDVFVTEFETSDGSNNRGISQIQPLPIARLTAVNDVEQIGKADAQIFDGKIYVLNEGTQLEKRFPEKDNQTVYHIALDNQAEEITDNVGRYTFGVWSESPLEPLRSRMLWKQAILITDILWRYRNIPREVHEIDVSHIKPEMFVGDTADARLQAYQTAIANYLSDYAKAIQKKKVDQGYVIIKGTSIYYTEPKRVAYTSPNEVMDQINTSIREGLGWYEIGQGTYAAELVTSSYIVLLPDLIAYKVKMQLLPMLKRHLFLKYGYADEQLSKLDMKLSLILDILRGEVVRQVAILAAAKTHTADQLREKLGDDPLTESQKAEIASQQSTPGREGQNAQTLADVLATAERTREGNEPLTPQSRRDRQQT